MTRTDTTTPARLSYLQYARHVAPRLVRHPTAIASIGTAFRQDTGVGADMPWWNQRAIRHLESQMRPGHRVFEWGSGGSTAWFQAQGAQVTSVEHNPGWVQKVRARCPGADVRAVPGVTAGLTAEPYLTHNLFGDGCRYFDDYIAAIGEFPDRSLDIVLVDGMCRAECFQQAIPKVRPGGLLIIDDSDMPPYRSLAVLVPGWEKTAFAGFKSSKDLRETTFFRCPG